MPKTAAMEPLEIERIRDDLGMAIGDFAEFMRADKRTIAAWEGGNKKPTASHCAVLFGLREALRRPKTRANVIKYSRASVGFGGVAYLIIRLFEECSTGKTDYKSG